MSVKDLKENTWRQAETDASLLVVLALPIAGMAFWDRLVAELRREGNTVEVWTEISEDAYRQRRGRIGALLMRFRVWCLFPCKVLWRLGWSGRVRRGVLFVPTTPFYLPAAAGLLPRLIGGTVVHLLYDLYPDQLVIAGKLRRDSAASRVLAWSTMVGLRQCAATVFLGERLKQVAEGRYGAARRGTIIEVGGDGDLFPGEVVQHAGVVRILYAGNFGYAHDYETLVQALACPLPEGIEIVFHSSGAGYEAFKRRMTSMAGAARVVLAGPLGTEDWVDAMARADIGLVTMRPGAEDILFPSKTYSAMLAGQAILAVCPAKSDLAATVTASQGGWVIEPGDAAALRGVLEELAAAPERVLIARQHAQDYARQHFEMRMIAGKWTRLLRELAPNG